MLLHLADREPRHQLFLGLEVAGTGMESVHSTVCMNACERLTTHAVAQTIVCDGVMGPPSPIIEEAILGLCKNWL